MLSFGAGLRKTGNAFWTHPNIEGDVEGIRELKMKRGVGIALALAGCLMVAPGLSAQSGAGNGTDGAGQSKAAENAKKPAQAPPQQATPQANPPGNSNPFPEDLSTVPVMPSKPEDLATGSFSESDNSAASLPGEDLDPVRSPDAEGAAEGSDPAQVSSSRESNLDSLLPGPGDDETVKGKKKGAIVEAPKETSQEDISVGKYYLDQKNWRAAQSRFQSALVLAPEDPDVYWGLAESARHLGKFADAKANYLKVIDYDPGSKHAKEAQKLLKDPEIENAKAAPAQ